MKARNVIILLVAAVFVFGSVAAYAQRGMGQGQGKKDDDRGFGRGFGQGMYNNLDLTADQIKQVQSIRLEAKKKLIPLQSDLELARIDLHEAIRSGATQSAVDAKIDAMSNIRSQMQKIRVGQMIQFRNLLTDEQKEKFDSRPMMMHDGGGRGMRGGDRGMGMRNGDCRFFGGGGHGPGDCKWFDDDGN